MFGFYFESILVISSGHLGFSLECVALHAALFSSSLSFLFVVLRSDSLVEELSSLTRAVTRLRLTFAVSFLFLFYLSFSFLLL